MKLEIENLGDADRLIRIEPRDETTVYLRAGHKNGLGYTILTRRQALAIAHALKAIATELVD